MLDCFSLTENLGDLKGKNILIVGDILHSRVALSNIYALKLLGANIKLSCPISLIPREIESLDVSIETDILKALKWCDAANVLRVQKERIENLSSFNFEKYKKHFQLSNEVLSQTPSDFAVFHPMPINLGIEIDEIAAKNEKFKYAEQLKFAIPARIISYRYALGNI